MRCKNSIVIWAIDEINGDEGIIFTDRIHIIALNRNGHRIKEKNEKIFIPLNKIIWTSNPTPEALKILKNYDFGIVTIIRQPEARQVASPVLPSAPNMSQYEELDEDRDGYLLPNTSTTRI